MDLWKLVGVPTTSVRSFVPWLKTRERKNNKQIRKSSINLQTNKLKRTGFESQLNSQLSSDIRKVFAKRYCKLDQAIFSAKNEPYET
jgi:hypothetical protein